MTENLLQKLEDKIVTLLSEMELLRNELRQVKQENNTLKAEKTNSMQKLQNVVALLDSIGADPEPIFQPEPPVANAGYSSSEANPVTITF